MSLPDPSDHWYEVGQKVANSVIDNAERPDTAKAVLDQVDAEWDAAVAHAPEDINLMAGFRDTLREHTERGNDV